DLEIWMDLCDRWMLGCVEWSEAAVLVANRRYQHALDKLQGLVIAWSTMAPVLTNLLSGYKICKNIAKALQACSCAIKTAIKQYNTVVAVLEVPHKPLSWEEVVNYINLSDFDLLGTSHCDILTEDWAHPAGHEAMDNYFKTLRANEEIKCLNIESLHLITYMHDEE
ncbi:hypothetical protein B0H14DRAFT_2246913, partial [Mycena olivaceomarginata]